jgi:hypothetical protein
MALVLTGCRGTETLTVRNSYLNANRYASIYADTPDPEVDCPVVGQVLNIHWYLPSKGYHFRKKEIVIRLRFGDGTHEEFGERIERIRGWFSYKLLDEMYFSKKGIISYHVALYVDGELISVAQHQLWAEVIEIGRED